MLHIACGLGACDGRQLHCIQPAECGGGSSVICDAVGVATHMRDHYPPELFHALTRVPVHFHRVQKHFESLAVRVPSSLCAPLPRGARFVWRVTHVLLWDCGVVWRVAG